MEIGRLIISEWYGFALVNASRDIEKSCKFNSLHFEKWLLEITPCHFYGLDSLWDIMYRPMYSLKGLSHKLSIVGDEISMIRCNPQYYPAPPIVKIILEY